VRSGGLNKLVTTDSERIVEMVTAVAEAVDEGDIPAIAARVDDEFKYRNWDKAGFIAELNSKAAELRVDEAKVGRFEIEIQGDVARASFRASCDWKGGSDAQAGVASLWTLECVRARTAGSSGASWPQSRPGYRIDSPTSGTTESAHRPVAECSFLRCSLCRHR